MADKKSKPKRISAKDLAKLMGVSTRTLTRMDESGVLTAERSPGGNRIYTTEHIDKAMDVMSGKRSREVEFTFPKKGDGLLRGRVEIPRRWLEKLGITRDEPEAWISFVGKKIIISKDDPSSKGTSKTMDIAEGD